MLNNGFRHIPVVEGEPTVGIVASASRPLEHRRGLDELKLAVGFEAPDRHADEP